VADGDRANLPDRTAEQRQQALHKANETRKLRAHLKTDIAASRVEIADVLAQPPAYAANLSVATLLHALPGYGPARVARLLTKTRISENKRLAGLTDRQRAELINHFQH
jgi:hypothetical protein